jgi:hypothetical protein
MGKNRRKRRIRRAALAAMRARSVSRAVEPMPLTVAVPRVESETERDSSAPTLRSPESSSPTPVVAIPAGDSGEFALPCKAVPALDAPIQSASTWLTVALSLLGVVLFALFVWSVADLEEDARPTIAAPPSDVASAVG